MSSRLQKPWKYGGFAGNTGVLSSDRAWRALVTLTESESSPALPGLTPRPRLLDRQGWSTLLAGALLLLISFTSNYGDDNLLRFSRLKTADQIGICLHLAALAALAGAG